MVNAIGQATAAAAVEQKPDAPIEEQKAPEQKPAAAEKAIDYKAEYERLHGENESLKQRAATAEGRLKNAVTREDLARIETEQRRISRELRDNLVELSSLDEEQKVAFKQKLSEEKTKEQVQEELSRSKNVLAKSIGKRLVALGMDMSHPQVGQYGAQWDGAATSEAFHAVYEALDDFIATEEEARIKKVGDDARAEATRERQAAARENGDMAVGAGTTGRPVSPLAAATADNIDALYVDFERKNPNKSNPYEAKYRQFIRTGEI